MTGHVAGMGRREMRAKFWSGSLGLDGRIILEEILET